MGSCASETCYCRRNLCIVVRIQSLAGGRELLGGRLCHIVSIASSDGEVLGGQVGWFETGRAGVDK